MHFRPFPADLRCKALAQKLAIRFGGRYPAGCSLVEVNAHSLFSRYFSESGKLVGRLFSRISELVEVWL
jgi:hypothetical protein